MPQRRFTVAEANAALSAVRPLAERLVEHGRTLRAAHERLASLTRSVAGNGGDIVPSDLAAAAAAVEREQAAVARCVAGIGELGGVVKDLYTGLVDFPSLRGGRDVMLCWRLGEEEVGHWHGLDEGFAGRKPLPPGGEGFGPAAAK